MSSNVVISAEGLGKKYLIGHESAERSDTFRDAISGSVRKLGRSAMNMMRGEAIIEGDEVEEFWALRDLNFEIRQGDVVGIIGRNGAGKSTLLKILSRITEPSEGRVSIKGRVASLLEVGTGFHPELSGRENIFLNGAILGMTRGEIRRKFDEIVAFSEVERFLDTPVKRYSSGMYVRLAFAVAAHLEPEILIVDEVLAVGDAEFQKKCLGKMQDVAGEGRTVIFVSHNMTAVRRLCRKGLYLEQGRKRLFGNLEQVISQYSLKNASGLGSSASHSNNDCSLTLEFQGNGLFRVTGNSKYTTRSNFMITVSIQTSSGFDVFETGSVDHSQSPVLSGDQFHYKFSIPIQDLRPGEYIAQCAAFLHDERWLIKKEEGPRVQFESIEAEGASPVFTYRPPGYGPLIQWQLT